MINMETILIGVGASKRPMNVDDLAMNLASRAQALYDSGWTVVGSYFKKSCLHPWKASTREQLLAWALEDFKTFRANSINLRLDGTSVIALDADFQSDTLTKRFLQELVIQNLVPKEKIFTVQGGKGCKVFFQMTGRRPSRLPNVFGPICYETGKGGHLDCKNMVELKTTLSTVFGAYPCANFPALYSEYPGTRYIALTTPQELPVLSWSDLERLKYLILGLYQLFDMVDLNNQPLSDHSQARDVLVSCIARGVMMAKRGESLITLFTFLTFHGAIVAAQALQDLLNNWEEGREPKDARFEFLPEGSSFRQVVKDFLAEIYNGHMYKINALSCDFEFYLANAREWLQDQLITLGASLEGREDVLSLFEHYDFCNSSTIQERKTHHAKI